jgi:hypothetical protein
MDYMDYSVTGRIYRVLDGKNAYEYTVTLLDHGEVVDEWDSLFECYSIHHDHLTHEAAVAAVQEITNDVHAGKASDWFDV